MLIIHADVFEFPKINRVTVNLKLVFKTPPHPWYIPKQYRKLIFLPVILYFLCDARFSFVDIIWFKSHTSVVKSFKG